MARYGNGNGNGNGRSRMPSIISGPHGTSYPCEDMAGEATRGGASLAVQDNANIANFIEDPAVFNESPATKKSYSWNRGETGNAT
jgi:hypothetical protein